LSYLETIAAGMSAFVYLKRAGKQRRWLTASGRGCSSHRFDGHVSGGIGYWLLDQNIKISLTTKTHMVILHELHKLSSDHGIRNLQVPTGDHCIKKLAVSDVSKIVRMLLVSRGWVITYCRINTV
jgi:hypothetical protein